MAGLWEAPKDRNELYLRGMAVAFLAFILTGFVYLAIQRIAGFATGRAAPAMSRAVGSEYLKNNAADAPDSAMSTISPMSPGVPAYRTQPYTAPPSFTSAVTLALPGAPGYSPFTVESQKKAAQAALRPLHEVMATVRHYDSEAVWTALSSPTSSGAASLKNVAGRAQVQPRDDDGSSNSDEDEASRVATLAAVAEAQRLRQNEERILGETESLSTELTLVAHPAQFPEPLRDGVGDVSRELRIYLATVQIAAAHPEERERLHSLATQHLSNSEAALARLDTMARGSGAN